MNRSVSRIAFFMALALSIVSYRAAAYEVGTHARLTKDAYARSSLSQGGKLKQLGLFDLNRVVGDGYIEFDNSGGSKILRKRFASYEDSIMARLLTDAFDTNGVPIRNITESEVGAYRPIGWLMSGAIREDDGAGLFRQGVPLSDVPLGGPFNRFCNHFYDPTVNSTLDAAAFSERPDALACDSVTYYQSAPAWALALQNGQNIFAAQTDANSRRNHFTIADAKEAMWRAATGYNKALTTKVALTAKDRLGYWASTFRSLGDVVHVLQDMAQPQHTRNEAHPFGVRGAYESWVEARIVSGAIYSFAVTNDFKPSQVNLGNYGNDFFNRASIGVPRFGSYVDYWHQSSGAYGLAQYSNAGFLTEGKSIGNTAYPLPPPNSADARYLPVVTTASEPTYLGDGSHGIYKRTYLTYPVQDVVSGLQERIRMTSRQALYRVMVNRGLTPDPLLTTQWAQDLNTFNDHAYLQLPRAVAYSAGLIDYFFRGQFNIEPPAWGMYAYTDLAPSVNTNPDATKNYAFKKLAFKLTNTTPAIAHSATNQILDQSFAVKSLVAVVKFHRNTGGGAGWKPDLSTEYGAPGQSFESNRDKANSKSAYDINQDESIVISTSCTVDGASPPGASNITVFGSGVARAIECDFNEEPIPVGSSDLYLQVVARGTLGTEEDAVVVQTIDISEPTAQVDGNAGDWFEVNGQLYRKEEIVGSVLQGVRAECRGATAPNPGCVAPSSLTTLYRAGAAQTPFFKSTVPSRRFTRVAFLLPVGNAAQFGSPDSGCGAWPGDTEATTIDWDVNQLEVFVASDGSYSSLYHYTTLEKSRGVVNLSPCITSLSAPAVKPTDFSRFDADLLTTAELEAVPVIWCIDSPAACSPPAASLGPLAVGLDSNKALDVGQQKSHFRSIRHTGTPRESEVGRRKRTAIPSHSAPPLAGPIIQRVSADQALQ